MNNNQILLIFPPQWTPISPHFAIPSLFGQLEKEGYNAKALDLNISFFDAILTSDNLINTFKIIDKQFCELKENIKKIYSADKKPEDYSTDDMIKMYKYNKLNKFIHSEKQSSLDLVSYIDNAKNVFKTDDFYKPEILIKALNVIDRALNILSLPYTPLKISFDGLVNPFFKFNYESIKYFVVNEEYNPFVDFYMNNLDSIISQNPSMYAISINSSSQVIPGLTLGKILKEKTNAHVNIGGNFFGRIVDELKEHSDFFDIFADSISIEEGEGPIIKLAEFNDGKRNIQDVPNLMYKKDSIVFQNEKMNPTKLNDAHMPSLNGYNLDKYFAPNIVMPFQTSRGCYWGKCSFCDQGFGQNFNVKNVDKVINEFNQFKEKYQIEKFEFIDESVSPSYLKELSENLLKNENKVSYFFDARLETQFTKEILENASKSGLKMVLWGLESGSDKVMEQINKGIDLDRRFQILTDSKNSDIWNFAFIFFGFPSETKEDAEMTIKMLVEHKDVIHSYGRSVFTMGRHARLAQEPEKYGITKIYPAEEEFSPNINFDCVGMNKKELNEILQKCMQECQKAYEQPLWMYLRYREWLFLYIDRYGVNFVVNYKLDFNR